jgi:type I restriction enzyme S subunit
MAAICEKEKRIIVEPTRPYREVEKGYTSFKRGDVLLAKITPCFENGKIALAMPLFSDVGFGSTEFHVFRTSSQEMALFVFHLLQLEWIRQAGAQSMKGAAGQKRVPAEFFETLQITTPASVDLKRFAQRIRKIELIKSNNRASFTELDKLFTSLQHRAFRGEL